MVPEPEKLAPGVLLENYTYVTLTNTMPTDGSRARETTSNGVELTDWFGTALSSFGLKVTEACNSCVVWTTVR
jgi:hypothetical protein